MKQYLDLLKDVLETGVERDDRTGVGTISKFGTMLRFDLADGFPAVTTKKLWFKGVIHELLWLLGGISNIKYLNDNGVHIWDAWADKYGNLGPTYPYQWRSWSDVTLVKKQAFEKPAKQPIDSGLDKQINIDWSKNDSGLVGKKFNTKCGQFVVIKENHIPREKSGHFKKFDVKFINTGFIFHNATSSAIKSGMIKDPYYPSICDVACLGAKEIYFDKPMYRDLYQTWFGMIRRCYDKNHIGFKNYGQNGVFVDDRWLVFSNFYTDAISLDNWLLKLEFPREYSLDKDYYCSNKYSSETCRWASKTEQSINTKMARLYRVTTDNGSSIECSKTYAARKYGFSTPALDQVLQNKYKRIKGYGADYIDHDKDYMPRITVNDQIKNIVAGLKHNCNSRRICLNAWNVADLHAMKLPPCHLFANFYVLDGKLSCMVVMRSSDTFLGLPFNIASYALLTSMLAQVTGFDVGTLVMSLGDTHIYKNHVDQVKEQLSREPTELPTLWLNPNIKCIDDFQYDDIRIKDYKCQPTIKAPVAV